jgi:2-C-methyl-D-erythritol 4-phosphate cytidylyltransferase
VTVAVVLAAAGRGERLGSGVVKALRELAGEPLVLHAVRGLRQVPAIGPVVVTAPVGLVNDLTVLLASYDVVVTAGGEERQESVRHGLTALPPGVDHVLVHDAARALAPPALFAAVIAALRAGAEAVVPVLPVADTVKRVIGDRVTGTVERGDLRAVQTPQGFALDVLVTAGGEERQESVRHGLTALPPGVDHVLVHDAARALAPPELFTAVIAALRAGAEAVVPVLPVADTVKRVIGDRVTGTVERGDLRAVQTPQGFALDLLVRAHAQTGPPATDDAALVERLGRTVHTVPGSEEAFKVTRAIDLVLAEAVLRARAT